jgi:hypothetical protein
MVYRGVAHSKAYIDIAFSEIERPRRISIGCNKNNCIKTLKGDAKPWHSYCNL